MREKQFNLTWTVWLQLGPIALRTAKWPFSVTFVVNPKHKGYSHTAWWLRVWCLALSWRW